jgi:L-threonylcarbamoyladenylate synthase
MPVIVRVYPDNIDAAAIVRAAAVLNDGGVVAFPTDTLYGLAADPRRSDAVLRIFALKGRPDASALPLIAADMAQARAVGKLDDVASRLAERWWPGPLTLVVPARAGLASEVLAGGRTVAVRVPAHDVARAIARAFGFPLTATSANRSGSPGTNDPDDVHAALPDVDLLVDAGRSPGGPPSTMVEVERDALRLIRAGAIAWDRVLESQQ